MKEEEQEEEEGRVVRVGHSAQDEEVIAPRQSANFALAKGLERALPFACEVRTRLASASMTVRRTVRNEQRKEPYR